MLGRQLHRRAIQSSLPTAGPSSIRCLSSVTVRPSIIALGKRPAGISIASAEPSSSLGSRRNLSWIPWQKSAESPANDVSFNPSSSESSIPKHEPILSSPHPDLQPSTSSPSDLVVGSSSASTPTSTSASSSLDSISTNPSHEFVAEHTIHTDPTPLLPQPPALANVPTFEDLVTNSGMALTDVLNSHEAVHAAIKTSDLALMGLDHRFYNLAGWARDALVSVHTITGLPWWASIAALTLGFRMCLLPLIVRTQKHNLRLAAINPQMTALMKRMQEARETKDFQAQQLTSRELQTLFAAHDVHPFKSLLLPLGQMPLFLSMFWGLETLAKTPLPQLKEGGFGWVLDLTATDPYWILPVTSVALTLGVLEVGGADGSGANTKANQMGHMKNVIRIASIAFIPVIGYSMPAAVLCYWTFNNSITLLQAIILKQPMVKRFLGIPTPKFEPASSSKPGDKNVNPNPSFLESWAELKKQFKPGGSAWERAQKYQQSGSATVSQTQAVIREKQAGRREGTGMMAEVINERSGSGSMMVSSGGGGGGIRQKAVAPSRSSSSQSFLEESTSTTTTTSSSSNSPVVETLTREQARKKRIAAARDRRARQ